MLRTGQILLLLLLCQMGIAQSGTQLLKQKVPAFVNEQTVFPDERYEGMTWKDFYDLPEANAMVSQSDVDLHLMHAAIHFAFCKMRDKKKKDIMAFDPQVRDAAMLHSFNMVNDDFFNHTDKKNKEFKTSSERGEAFGIEAGMAECIAYNWYKIGEGDTYIDIAEKVIDQFMNSPPHKEILMDTYNHVGSALYFEKKPDGPYQYFKVTMNFLYIQQ